MTVHNTCDSQISIWCSDTQEFDGEADDDVQLAKQKVCCDEENTTFSSHIAYPSYLYRQCLSRYTVGNLPSL